MAKPPARNNQLSILLPLSRSSNGALTTQSEKVSNSVTRTVSNGRLHSSRDELIDRLRRDGYFDLQKKK